MAQCMMPFLKKNDLGNEVLVPCGRCPECLKRRASGWSFRLMQEEKSAHSALFVTLTYNADHLQFTSRGFKTLHKPDLQNYFKRLRKLTTDKIKYYACGEYGNHSTKRMRPHYHVILFNSSTYDAEKAWSLDGRSLGHVHFGTVSGASIGYVLKYMTKPGLIPVHRNDDRVKEFSLMSKGLGRSYLTPEMIAWHKNRLADRMYIPIEDGKKIAMPRYFKDKIYDDDERSYIAGNWKADFDDVDLDLDLQAEEKRIRELRDYKYQKMFRDSSLNRERFDND